MRSKMIRLLITATLLISSSEVASAQSAQWAPGKTVKIVVPFPPGGTADVVARLLAQQVTQAGGQQIIIENKPGGGTVTGTEVVARSAPDGTTLLLMSNSFVINASLKSTLPYDPLTSFVPVCSLVYSPLVLAVANASPLQTFAAFRAAATVKPAVLSVAAVGPATTQHIALEMLKRAAGIDFNYVPFPGGAPAVTTLVGNHVSAALANYDEMKENLGSNLRALAVGAEARIAALQDVPTLGELGFGAIIGAARFGLVVPAATPPAAVEQMIGLFKASLEARQVATKLDDLGLVRAVACGADFGALLESQHGQYARAIKDAGIKPE